MSYGRCITKKNGLLPLFFAKEPDVACSDLKHTTVRRDHLNKHIKIGSELFCYYRQAESIGFKYRNRFVVCTSSVQR